MVSSGRPSPPHFRVSSEPSSVPTVRLTLRIGSSISTVLAVARARASASAISCWSSARSRPWSCAFVQ